MIPRPKTTEQCVFVAILIAVALCALLAERLWILVGA